MPTTGDGPRQPSRAASLARDAGGASLPTRTIIGEARGTSRPTLSSRTRPGLIFRDKTGWFVLTFAPGAEQSFSGASEYINVQYAAACEGLTRWIVPFEAIKL